MKVFTKILVIFALCLAGTSSNELIAYPLQGGFIASLFIEPSLLNVTICTDQPETVVILDRSGSMGDSVRRIVTEILPEFFRKLDYSEFNSIHLITFSNDAMYNYTMIRDLPTFPRFKQGGTYMLPAVELLKDLFVNFQKNELEALRILTISDGLISLQDQTITASDELADFAEYFPLLINSQAVRWQEPTADTRALSSLLQLSNVKAGQTIPSWENETNNEIADDWAALFDNDGLCGFQTIVNSEPVFLVHPWDTIPHAQLHLTSGENTIWMNSVPTDATIAGTPVVARQLPAPSNYRLYRLMENKYEYFVHKMKVLKVVNSPASLSTVDKILEYFKAIDEEVPPPEGVLGFSDLLEEIAADDSIAEMSPDELAEYLSQIRVEMEPPPFVPDESGMDRDDLWSNVLGIYGKQ